jgi:hypothetical protein
MMTTTRPVREALEASAARHADQSVREFAEYLIALDDGLSDAEARAKVWQHDGLVGKARPPSGGLVTCICDVESGTVCARHSVKAKAANTISVQSDPLETFTADSFNLKVSDVAGDTTYERILYGDAAAVERCKAEGFRCHCGATHFTTDTRLARAELRFACGYPAKMTAFDDAFIRDRMFTLASGTKGTLAVGLPEVNEAFVLSAMEAHPLIVPETGTPAAPWLINGLKARAELAGLDFSALTIDVLPITGPAVRYAWALGEGSGNACGGNVSLPVMQLPADGSAQSVVIDKFVEVLRVFADTTDPGPHAILPIDSDEKGEAP